MATTTVAPKGISERNRRLLTALYRSSTGPFFVREAAAALSFTMPRTHRFLAYLAERGWLLRVCRGLYAPIPLDAIDPSAWREDPWVIASKLFGPHCYVGGWTACEHWDLTEQIFRETVVVTTKRVRGKEADIQGFPFRIRRTTPRKAFGTKAAWQDQTRVYVSDPSRTVIDVLDDPTLGGGGGGGGFATSPMWWTHTSGASTVTTLFLRITPDGSATARASSAWVTFWRHWISMHPLFSKPAKRV